MGAAHTAPQALLVVLVGEKQGQTAPKAQWRTGQG